MNILNEREKTHGSFSDVSRVAQRLKYEVWSSSIPDIHQEALDMICTKMARIVCGDHNEPDHWTDIMGYAKLVLKTLAVPPGSSTKGTPDEPKEPSVGDDWDSYYIPRSGLPR